MRMRHVAASIALLVAGASVSPVTATTEGFALPGRPAGEQPSVRPPEYAPLCAGSTQACMQLARRVRPHDASRHAARSRAVKAVKTAAPTGKRPTVVKHGNGSNLEPVAQQP